MINKADNKVIIFGDGASKGNPGPGGWGAVVVQDGRVEELGGRDNRTTNNRMELTAVLEALKLVPRGKEIMVFTDSKYVISGMTGWIYGWQKNDWQTQAKEPVLNRDIWEELAFAAEGKKIEWKHVGGHIGVAGNERCDTIASYQAEKKTVELYRGPLVNYKIDIYNLGSDDGKVVKKSTAGVKAYSYLSLVDGKLYRDLTWAECEARVKGKRNVKYKKAVSLEDENEIKKSWQV